MQFVAVRAKHFEVGGWVNRKLRRSKVNRGEVIQKPANRCIKLLAVLLLIFYHDLMIANLLNYDVIISQ